MSRQVISPSEDLQVRNLLRDFWTAVDREDWAAVPNLLTDDIEYLMGGACQGRTETVEKLKGRPQFLLSRHLISNESVRGTDDGYEMDYVGFVYSVITDPSKGAPYQSPPANIFDGYARMRFVGDEIKLSKLTGAAIFMKTAK